MRSNVVSASLLIGLLVAGVPAGWAETAPGSEGDPGLALTAASLDSLEQARVTLVDRMFAGDTAGMEDAAAVRERCLERLHEALLESPGRVNELAWPDQERWLAAALFERRRDWSRMLLEAMEGRLPESGLPSRGPVALAVGLNGLALLEEDPEDENAFVGTTAPLHVAVRLSLAAAAGEDFLLRDEAFYRLWKLAEADGDTTGAAAWADSLVNLAPRSTRVPEVRLTVARSLFARGKVGEAIDEARQGMPEADSAELRWFLVEADLRLGFEGEAARELDRLIGTFPADPLAAQAWELRLELGDRNPDLYLSLDERLALAEPLLALPQSGVVQWMTAVADSGSLPPAVREEAALSLAGFFYRTRQYPRARAFLGDLAVSENVETRTEGELLDARIHRNTGQTRAMADLYRGIRERGGTMGETAAWELGREQESLGRWKEAAATYTDFLERFPNSARRRDVSFRRGFDRVRLGRNRDAVEDFRTALRASISPEDREQAAFWLYRTLTELGDGDGAHDAASAGLRAPEPADYYGVRLRELLGEEPEPVPPPEPGEDITVPLDQGDWPAPVQWHYTRGAELCRLGVADAARREWGRAARLGDGLYPILRSLCVSAAVYDLYPEGVYWANRTADLLAEGHPAAPGFQRFSLPAAYYGSVEQAAAREGVSPFLVWGLIRQESFYDPLAVSRAGALGLMQLLPATLERMVGEGSTDPLPEESLLLPDVNIELGTRFLADRLAEFGHGLLPTLASYNAGEGKSREWLELAGGDEEEIFVECIGYPETSGYVRRIPRNIWIYRSCYAGAEPPAGGGTDR